jgi:hypothetical protein
MRVTCLSRAVGFGGLMAVSMLGCSRATPAVAPSGLVQSYPTIVRLEGRQYSVLITAGPKSPLYTVSRKSGEVLVANASLNEMRDTHPELFNLLAPALSPEASASADGAAWAGSQ